LDRIKRLFVGGSLGNEHLTAVLAAVLLLLLAIEGATLLQIGSLLTVHAFVGMLLIPVLAVKVASTGWRFLRYYTGNKPYRLEGPPRLLLRLLAPLLVASTLVVFGSGTALLVVGRSDIGPMLEQEPDARTDNGVVVDNQHARRRLHRPTLARPARAHIPGKPQTRTVPPRMK